jgi:tetratricopeptide (TPR) repeat protein
MSEDPYDELVDDYLDRALRGSAPDPETFFAEHPDLPEAVRIQVRKLSGVMGSKSTTPSASAQTPSEIEPGLPFERLGGFRLLRRLGSGGMGQVFLAEEESVQRQVALKILHASLSRSSRAANRLDREAQVVAKFRHEHIALLYQAGEEDEVRYLAMEYIPGRGLDECIGVQQIRGTVSDAVKWCRDIALALEYAHQAGVTHRDVKPSNIRVTAAGRALLLDFGLALDADLKSLSRNEGFRGTPVYASPEQVESRSRAIGPRSDVYSLGVTLYECVTGSIPFDGETSAQIFHQILSQDPDSPRRRNPAVSQDLEAVILRALEKDPDLRYPTAAAFAEDLDALLHMRPVHALPLTWSRRLTRWVRRHPPSAAAVLLAFLLFVVGPLVLFLQERRTRRIIDGERQTALAAGAAEAQARQQMEELLHHAVEQNSAFLFQFADQVRQLAGGARLSLGMIQEVVSNLDYLDQKAGSDSVLRHTLIRALVRLGDLQGYPAYSHVGDFEAAVLTYQRAAQLAQELFDRGDIELGEPMLAYTYTRLGFMLYAEQQMEEATEYLESAVEIYEKLAASAAKEAALLGSLSDAYRTLGSIYGSSGDHDAALECFLKSLAIEEERLEEAPDSLEVQFKVGVAHGKLAAAYSQMGRLEQAIDEWYFQLDISREVAELEPVASYKTTLADTLVLLCRCLVEADRAEEGEECGREALADFEELRAGEPSSHHYYRMVGESCFYIGEALQKQASADEVKTEEERRLWLEARDLFQRSLRHFEVLEREQKLPAFLAEAPAKIRSKLQVCREQLGAPIDSE